MALPKWVSLWLVKKYGYAIIIVAYVMPAKVNIFTYTQEAIEHNGKCCPQDEFLCKRVCQLANFLF